MTKLELLKEFVSDVCNQYVYYELVSMDNELTDILDRLKEACLYHEKVVRNPDYSYDIRIEAICHRLNTYRTAERMIRGV